MKAKDLSYIAICTALIVICSWLTIALPIMQFTLQVFAVAFCAYFLGVKRSVFSVLVFLLLGVVGLPVFSNFNSGYGAIVGPSGGFLIGFIPFVVIISSFELLAKGKIFLRIVGAAIAHLVLYAVGISWYVVLSVTSKGSEFFTVLTSFTVAMLPLYAIDIIKIVGAMFLASFLKKVLDRK